MIKYQRFACILQMEPIKAFDHLQRMRQDEREAAEAAAAAKLREIEAEETGGANEKQPNPEAEPGLGEQTFTPAAHTALGESGQVTVGIDPTTYDTTDYDEYKFLQTAGKFSGLLRLSHIIKRFCAQGKNHSVSLLDH